MDNTMNGGGDHHHHSPYHGQETYLEDIPLKPPKAKKPVPDGVTTIDCTPYFKCLGLTSPWLRRVWFVKDICGLVCAVITWMLLLYAEYVVMIVMLLPQFFSPYNFFNAIVYNFFSFMALSSHLRAMLTDPGAVPKGNATRDNILKMGLRDGEVVFKCPKCVSIKPERAHHCSVCQRCIRKMDHHCPWVNNCVGETNQKYFVLFTMYICIISFHALYLAVTHFVTCLGKEWKSCSGFSPPATTVFLIFLIFEALLFGIFTGIMFGTQVSAICSDETGIEQLKREAARWERKSRWRSMKGVFGQPFGWHWFSPFATPKFAYMENDLHTV
ncbi:hypothetical protein V1264_001342 [Littorina saxatilis]